MVAKVCLCFHYLCKDVFCNTELQKKCTEGWALNPFRSTCVWMSLSKETHTGAAIECQKSGASLAIFDSLKSYDWLVSLKTHNSGKSM